jgi:hypothetical protein
MKVERSISVHMMFVCTVVSPVQMGASTSGNVQQQGTVETQSGLRLIHKAFLPDQRVVMQLFQPQLLDRLQLLENELLWWERASKAHHKNYIS